MRRLVNFGRHPSLRDDRGCKSLASSYLCPMAAVVDIGELLRRHHLRVTRARTQIYAILERSRVPTTAAQILSALKRVEVHLDIVTVYRTLDTLERCGLVAKSDRMKEGWRYVARSAPHGHVVVCTECGTSAAIATCELERFEQSVHRCTGYTDIRHTLQFQGRCPDCARA